MAMTSLESSGERAEHLIRVADRGIIVWLWLGLLTAYISTSALFGGQLFNSITGAYGNRLPVGLAGVVIAYSTAPAFLVALGWATLLQFTGSAYDILVGTALEVSPNDSEFRYTRDLMRSRFRISVILLALSWVASLLIVSIAPLIIYFSYGFWL